MNSTTIGIHFVEPVEKVLLWSLCGFNLKLSKFKKSDWMDVLTRFISKSLLWFEILIQKVILLGLYAITRWRALLVVWWKWRRKARKSHNEIQIPGFVFGVHKSGKSDVIWAVFVYDVYLLKPWVHIEIVCVVKLCAAL